jgi:hypothetical protein
VATVQPLDGGLFDMLTMLVGITTVVIKTSARAVFGYSPVIGSKTGVDFLHGCVIFPFMMLAALPIALGMVPYIHDDFLLAFIELIKTKNSGSVALAGGVGIFFVLSELTIMW